MFHKEIRDGESKRGRILYDGLFGEKTSKFKNPEEMNFFIKNLMDPFKDANDNKIQDFDSYYDDYYELYGIPKDVKDLPIELKTKMFNAPQFLRKNT